LAEENETLVFHAGTRQHQQHIVTDGGRVLAVTGKGKSLKEAREAAYAQAEKIRWDGLYFRKDIGVDLLNYKGI
jgi:phosphoribosylamine--glycine ligase